MRNCTEIREKLSAFVDGELSEKDYHSIEDHLRVCPSCAQEAENIKRIMQLMDDLPEHTPSPTLVYSILYRVAWSVRHSFCKERFLKPALSLLKNVVGFVLTPEDYNTSDRRQFRSYEYLRDFDDSPPGSFADVYITLVQGAHK